MSWPRGIEILLSYGANVNVIDNQNFYPLDHAIFRGFSESVALFATMDCELRPAAWNSKRDTLKLAIFNAVSKPTDQAKIDIAKSVIIIAANQRRKLKALLSRYLSKNPICVHSSFENQLLDVYAFDAVTALKQHDVSMPIWWGFNKYPKTIYHVGFFIIELLDFLWEAGFRDLNEPDCDGETPLMQLRTYKGGWAEQVNWFLDKGVDPNQQIQQIHQNSYRTCNSERRCCPCLKSGHTVMHFLAFNLSRYEWDNCKMESQSLDVADPKLTTIQDIFNNESRDACKCACSSAGCRAINIIVKNRFSCSVDLQELFHSTIRFISLLKAKANDFISETTFTEIIRTLTFDALGLTHTCCRANKKPWLYPLPLVPFGDEDDILEIHDEEREDLHLLEDLLSEFEQRRRDESSSSFHHFIKVHWSTRMWEVLSERNLSEVLSEEESSDEILPLDN